MRLPAVVVSVCAVVAFAKTTRACPSDSERSALVDKLEHLKAERTMLGAKLDRARGEPVAIAIASGSDEPGLGEMLDRMAFGDGEPPHSVGVVVTGVALRAPLGPLAALSGSSLRGGPHAGELADAGDLALAVLVGTHQPRRVLILVGRMATEARDALVDRAEASGVDVRELASADMYLGLPADLAPAQDPIAAQLAGPAPAQPTVPRVPADEPSSPSRWPALALLALAALMSRRATARV